MDHLRRWFSKDNRIRRFWIRHPVASGACLFTWMVLVLGFFAIRDPSSDWWTWLTTIGGSAFAAVIIAMINRNERDMQARRSAPTAPR